MNDSLNLKNHPSISSLSFIHLFCSLPSLHYIFDSRKLPQYQTFRHIEELLEWDSETASFVYKNMVCILGNINHEKAS